MIFTNYMQYTSNECLEKKQMILANINIFLDKIVNSVVKRQTKDRHNLSYIYSWQNKWIINVLHTIFLIFRLLDGICCYFTMASKQKHRCRWHQGAVLCQRNTLRTRHLFINQPFWRKCLNKFLHGTCWEHTSHRGHWLQHRWSVKPDSFFCSVG